MTLRARPLAACVINISISESDDSSAMGFPSWQVNRVVLQFVAALLGQGASVVFGHDWREDGIMEAVCGFARQMQSPIPPSEGKPKKPLINLVPWPDKPFLSIQERERLSTTLMVEEVPLSSELLTIAKRVKIGETDSREYRYLRARALTLLRHYLSEISDARICIGGRSTGFAGRYPGVVEEAVMALRSQKPLYLDGFLGGATSQLVDAIEGKKMPDGFCQESPEELFRDPPFKEQDETTLQDRIIDRKAIWDEFARVGSQTIADRAHLKKNELEKLFHTRVVDHAIELVLTGLSRLKAKSH